MLRLLAVLLAGLLGNFLEAAPSPPVLLAVAHQLVDCLALEIS